MIAEPYDTDYGSHDCTLLDPEGNHWQFGTYPGQARPEPGVGASPLARHGDPA